MKRNSKIYYSVIFLAGLLAFFVFVSGTSAQEIDKERAIQIVSEKGGPGGCSDETNCSSFCENPDNFQACIDWARENGLMSSDDAERTKKFAGQGRNFSGPGGCSSPEECRAFCENPQNHNTCIDFAVSQGFMSREEAEKIKEFRNKAERFREEAEKEREKFEHDFDVDPEFDKDKALSIVESQGGPGGCRSFEECEAFCEQEQNQQTCFEFAEEKGLFKNSEHAKKIKKVLTEGGPGGCRGESQCRQFCENPDNFEVCIDFAEKNDFIPPEHVERAKRGIQALKEGGPDGCRGPKECEEVCRRPENQEACFEWAKKHNLISEEELERIEEFKERGEELKREFEQRRGEFEKRGEEFKPSEGFHPPGESGQFPVPPEFEAVKKCSENGGFWTGSACEFRKEGEYRQEGEYKPPADFTPPPDYNYPQYTRQPEYNPQYTPPPQYSPVPESSPTYYEEKQYPESYEEQKESSIIQESGGYILNSFKEFLR